MGRCAGSGCKEWGELQFFRFRRLQFRGVPDQRRCEAASGYMATESPTQFALRKSKKRVYSQTKSPLKIIFIFFLPHSRDQL
jgi:hypothetical protein